MIKALPAPPSPILHTGCGNSRLAADLVADGFTSIVNVDFSESCIAQMRAHFTQLPTSVSWDVGDVRRLAYADASFACVLDKGTLDAVVCDRDRRAVDLAAVVAEMHRVLQPGGRWVLLSHTNRQAEIMALGGWTVLELATIDDRFFMVFGKAPLERVASPSAPTESAATHGSRLFHELTALMDSDPLIDELGLILDNEATPFVLTHHKLAVAFACIPPLFAFAQSSFRRQRGIFMVTESLSIDTATDILSSTRVMLLINSDCYSALVC